MTRTMFATLALAAAGQILYQIGQRAVPANASPLIVLTFAYAGAAFVCFAFAWTQDSWTAVSLSLVGETYIL